MSEAPSSWVDAAGAMQAARYVNASRIDYTRWDMTIDFLLVTPVGDIPETTGTEPDYAAERAARIIMSPMHAKALAESLSEAVGTWENRFGPLPEGGTR